MSPAGFRWIAISPGDGRPLGPWLDGLASVGWPAVLLREPSLDEDTVARAVSAVPEVILHARTPGAIALARSLRLPLHVRDGAPAPEGQWSASVHDEDAAEQRLSAGARFVVWAPVWAPTSKPDDRRPPLGAERFFAFAVGRSVIALGGVDVPRAAELVRGGAHGAAILGGLGPDAVRAGDYLALTR